MAQPPYEVCLYCIYGRDDTICIAVTDMRNYTHTPLAHFETIRGRVRYFNDISLEAYKTRFRRGYDCMFSIFAQTRKKARRIAYAWAREGKWTYTDKLYQGYALAASMDLQTCMLADIEGDCAEVAARYEKNTQMPVN